MHFCFKFCPACGKQGIHWVADRYWRCPACGFEYFHNVATAAGLILTKGEEVLVVVRAQNPACGKLALPGGFVDPGERAEDTVRRECREEIGWQPEIIRFLASFPNTYTYRSVVYNTCDLYFTADATDLDVNAISCDPDEVSGIRWIHPAMLDTVDIAFDSTRKAIQSYAARLASKANPPPSQGAQTVPN
ncbi:MAG: NUDIX domain-containing protein [Spirochaetota bacterium]